MLILQGEYSFNKVTKTIDFSGGLYAGILNISHFNAIFDSTHADGITIFRKDKFSTGLGGTFAADVLTLDFDTNIAGIDNTDVLAIHVDIIAEELNKLATKNNQDTLNLFLLGRLDVALSSLLKAADTLTKVATVDTITNVVHVDDNGGSLSVDGAVTANAGTNLNTSALALEATLQSVKTAVEIIDNFISGSRGLVTEDNSASIRTAVETIDNFISGSRGLVTEDNSGAIKTAVEIIDNFISGSRGLVTEDNSLAIKTALETLVTTVYTTTVFPGINISRINGAAPNLALETGGNLASMLTSLQLIDNFISGSRGLVTEDNSGAIKTSVELIDNAVSGSGFNISQVNGTNIDTNSGNKSAGTQRMVLATDQPNLTTPLNISVNPQTSGGLTTYHLVSAGTTNAASVKASAGQLYGWYIYNSNAAARKVVFHNTAGTPTAGASVFFSIVIPPTSGANVEFTNGIAFSTGIGITTVTGLADSDSAAVAANDLIINLFYK